MSYAGYGAQRRDVRMGRAFAAFLVSMTALLIVPVFNHATPNGDSAGSSKTGCR